jgi:chromosome segregation ATPase
MGICSHKQTARQKIADLKETAKVDETLIKHYEHILAHFDAIDTELVDEIAVIQEKRETLLQQFIKAPEELIGLNKHLAEIQQRTKGVKDEVSGKTKKLNRFKSLSKKLKEMEQEFAAQGINVDEALEKMAREEQN